jgi:hypothetical protein
MGFPFGKEITFTSPDGLLNCGMLRKQNPMLHRGVVFCAMRAARAKFFEEFCCLRGFHPNFDNIRCASVNNCVGGA